MTGVIISESRSTTNNNTHDLTKINHPNLFFMNIKHALDLMIANNPFDRFS